MYRTLDMAQWLAVELQSLIPKFNIPQFSKKTQECIKNVTLQKEYGQNIHSTLHLKNTIQSVNY